LKCRQCFNLVDKYIYSAANLYSVDVVGDVITAHVKKKKKNYLCLFVKGGSLQKRSCRTCGTPQKYGSALSTSVPKLDLGRFVGPKLVRVRGQDFQTFGEKGEEEDGLFSF